MAYEILWDIRASSKTLNSEILGQKLGYWNYTILNESHAQEDYSGYFYNDIFSDSISNTKNTNDYFTTSFGTFFYSELFETAKLNGFGNGEIKNFFKKEEERIFVIDTSENVKTKVGDLLQNELSGFCDINEINSYIQTRIAIFISKLKKRVCQDTKKLETDIKRLASITSFEYFRSFLKLPSAVV